MTTTQDIIIALNDAHTKAALEAALALVRVDIHKLRAAAEDLRDCEPTEAMVQAYRLAFINAGVPDEAVEPYASALNRLSALHHETPEQRAIREAFAQARHLMDTLGDEHPQTHAAVIRALELQDPGCCARMALACGITLPEPDFCDDEGRPLFSSQSIAAALDIPHEKVMADIERLIGDGMSPHTGAKHRRH